MDEQNKQEDQTGVSASTSNHQEPILPPPPGPPSVAVQATRLSWVGALVISLLVSCLISMAMIKVYHDQYAFKIVTVDARQVIADLKTKMNEGELDERDLREALDQFDYQINHQPPGTVVLLEEVVLTKTLKLEDNSK